MRNGSRRGGEVTSKELGPACEKRGFCPLPRFASRGMSLEALQPAVPRARSFGGRLNFSLDGPSEHLASNPNYIQGNWLITIQSPCVEIPFCVRVVHR